MKSYGEWMYTHAHTHTHTHTHTYTQSGASLMYCITKQDNFYYKVRQLFCITKRGNWYYKVGQVLQNEATFITKWCRYYKVGHLLQSTEDKWEKNGRVIYFGVRQFAPRISWEVGPLLELKEKKIHTSTTYVSA